ncbi:MAG: OmpA family protein, partial [Cytophagaceae bacterium]
RNIFFDFDKATLRPESSLELERLYQLLVDIPTLKIEISGHTDNKGSAEYNKELSGKRAQAVVDYLITKGIKADRLKSAGYGFDRPMASNDTDAGRQLNRRTEFEIIEN